MSPISKEIMITKYGDIISRQERIYIFKTFVSIDLLRKDQVFAKLYSDMKEKKLLNYIVCLNDPESYLLKPCGSLLTSKL